MYIHKYLQYLLFFNHICTFSDLYHIKEIIYKYMKKHEYRQQSIDMKKGMNNYHIILTKLSSKCKLDSRFTFKG